MVTYQCQKTEDGRYWINVRLSIRNLAQRDQDQRRVKEYTQ